MFREQLAYLFIGFTSGIFKGLVGLSGGAVNGRYFEDEAAPGA